MKKSIAVYGVIVLVSMLFVTSWASLQEGVFVGGGKLLDQPWGVATLADTYFAFFMFYLWVLYKERSYVSKIVWFVAIVLLGNIAMAVYLLIQVKNAKADNFEGIVLRENSNRLS